MSRSSKYTLFLFYSNSNQQSLRSRVAINEIVSESIEWADINVNEIDFNKDTSLAQRYHVFGTPAIVILKGEQIVKRHLGEITADELLALVKEL